MKKSLIRYAGGGVTDPVNKMSSTNREVNNPDGSVTTYTDHTYPHAQPTTTPVKGRQMGPNFRPTAEQTARANRNVGIKRLTAGRIPTTKLTTQSTRKPLFIAPPKKKEVAYYQGTEGTVMQFGGGTTYSPRISVNEVNMRRGKADTDQNLTETGKHNYYNFK